jgi:hypothetical protein
VASKVSQYNIWDEYLTQISGLTACYLRDDLADHENYAPLQAMYACRTWPMCSSILYRRRCRSARTVPRCRAIADIKRTAHYYHAPAMGKCFPSTRASSTWPARSRSAAATSR